MILCRKDHPFNLYTTLVVYKTILSDHVEKGCGSYNNKREDSEVYKGNIKL